MATDLKRLQQLANGTYGGVFVSSGIAIREIAGRDGVDTLDSGDASRTFLVEGSADPLACRTAMLLYPNIKTYDGMNITTLEREVSGPTSWTFTASYSRTAPSVPSGSNPGYTISIDTTGGTLLRTVAISETRYGTGAADFKGAIDVQDGVAQGVEIVIPALKINVRARIASQYITSPAAYANIIAELTGTTNLNAEFGGAYAAGELLFLGASGEIVGNDPTLTFSFAASKNITGLTIGGISGVAKTGHQYLWCEHHKRSTLTLYTKQKAGMR